MSKRCDSLKSATSMLGMGLHAQSPVPRLLAAANFNALLVGSVDDDVGQPGLGQPLVSGMCEHAPKPGQVSLDRSRHGRGLFPEQPAAHGYPLSRCVGANIWSSA